MPATDQRHPYAVWGAAVCVLSGATILFGGPEPNSLNALVLVWGVMLTIGGALLLLSNLIRDPLWTLLLERLGSGLLGAMCLIYTVAALVYGGAVAVFPASLAAAFGIASLWRLWQITKRLHRYLAIVRRIQHVEERRAEDRRRR